MCIPKENNTVDLGIKLCLPFAKVHIFCVVAMFETTHETKYLMCTQHLKYVDFTTMFYNE